MNLSLCAYKEKKVLFAGYIFFKQKNNSLKNNFIQLLCCLHDKQIMMYSWGLHRIYFISTVIQPKKGGLFNG